MTVAIEASSAFIQRWQGKNGSEKANYQLFLTELCELLAVDKPEPAQADNKQNAYVFERRVDMLESLGRASTGFIDLYKRDSFVLEAKSTGKKIGSGGLDMALERAYNQAKAYITNLPSFEKKPPFLIVTDVGHVLQVYSEFTCSGSTYTAFPDQNAEAGGQPVRQGLQVRSEGAKGAHGGRVGAGRHRRPNLILAYVQAGRVRVC
mgnify:CR=1 FL=1